MGGHFRGYLHIFFLDIVPTAGYTFYIIRQKR